MENHPRCPVGYGSNTWLKRELAHQNVTVSNETIRKWLAGEMMPRRAKMTALAKMLRVDETWLAMGTQPVAKSDRERAERLIEALREIKSNTDDPAILAIINSVCEDD